jgi:hypothetical protein
MDNRGSDTADTRTPDSQQRRPEASSLAEPSTESRGGRVPESPMEVSPIGPSERHRPFPSPQIPTVEVDESSNSEHRSVSPVSEASSSSRSLAEADTPTGAEESSEPTAFSPDAEMISPSTSRSTPTWSDSSLRTYMDNDEDIRDLLIIVHDKSNVVPAGPDHPITGNLFGAEKGRLAEMQSDLDSMLTGWLARKKGNRF